VWQDEGREEGRQEANIQKAIKDVVIIVKKWRISLGEAMTLLELDEKYREQVIDELRKQGVEFVE